VILLVVNIFFQTNPEEIRRKELIVESSQYTPYSIQPGDEKCEFDLFAKSIVTEEVKEEDDQENNFSPVPNSWLMGKEIMIITLVMSVATAVSLYAFYLIFPV